MNVIVYVLGLSGAVCGAVGWLCYHRLAEMEYAHHPDDWVKDGRPVGYADSHKHAAFLEPNVMNRWLLHSPEWALANPKAMRMLAVMRLVTAIMVLCLVGIFAIVITYVQ